MEAPAEKIRCIKASCVNYDAKYATEDLDAYYCPDCDIERKAVARHIDKKMKATGPKKPIKSDLQLYDEQIRATGIKFPRA